MADKGALIALLLVAAPAAADDRGDGVAPGAFRAAPAGAVTAMGAAVTLDGERVGVTLRVVARPVPRGQASVRLDLPRFGWLGEGESYPDRQFPELAVSVDGRVVAPVEDFTASARGRDVTAAVRAAGLDPFAIAETPPFVEAAPGRRAAFDALVAGGAVRQAPEGHLAAWSAARMVRVPLRAGAHAVAFRYTARPAFALTPLPAADVRWADYCTTRAAVARVLVRTVGRGPVVVRRYAIPVAVDGRRPRATLRVRGADAALTVVCGANGAALADPAGFVAVRPGVDGVVRVLRVVRPG